MKIRFFAADESVELFVSLGTTKRHALRLLDRIRQQIADARVAEGAPLAARTLRNPAELETKEECLREMREYLREALSGVEDVVVAFADSEEVARIYGADDPLVKATDRFALELQAAIKHLEEAVPELRSSQTN